MASQTLSKSSNLEGDPVSVSGDGENESQHAPLRAQEPLGPPPAVSCSEDLYGACADFEPVFTATPGGKPCTMFSDGKPSPHVPIPDKYDDCLSDPLVMLPHGYKHICPIRDCQKLWSTQDSLSSHFSSCHASVQLQDNLDGTLTVIGKLRPNVSTSNDAPNFAVVKQQEVRDGTCPALPTIVDILPHSPTSKTDPAKDKRRCGDPFVTGSQLLSPANYMGSSSSPSATGSALGQANMKVVRQKLKRFTREPAPSPEESTVEK